VLQPVYPVLFATGWEILYVAHDGHRRGPRGQLPMTLPTPRVKSCIDGS
jgi:hypothetical protein